jgi:hypothetical protein
MFGKHALRINNNIFPLTKIGRSKHAFKIGLGWAYKAQGSSHTWVGIRPSST